MSGYHFENKLYCIFGDKCLITVSNRKQCKRCRLDKCLSVGMKSELIYSEKRIEIRRHIVAENRRRRQMLANKSPEATVQSDSNSSFDTTDRKIIVSIDCSQPTTTAEDINAYNTDTNTTSNSDESDQQLDYKPLLPINDYDNTFASLSENDQMVLIKYSSVEINLLRMISVFNFRDGYWDIVLNNRSHCIKLDLFIKNVEDNCGGYQLHRTFVENMGLDWESDPLIIDFLTPIVLFNPNRPKLTDIESVQYLNMKFKSEMLAKAKLIRLIDSLRLLNVLHTKIAINSAMKKGPNLDAFPLFREIIDRSEANMAACRNIDSWQAYRHTSDTPSPTLQPMYANRESVITDTNTSNNNPVVRSDLGVI
ncbi:unnamed protein product [Medioppia subpectinata]|uniref:Nuclear receptor domain-containing protein n=1 Tax=Medioppia subpectinata TaxID=1979941 RepID=A0A7R9PTB9_9ACAR|nr:unnamed protein product [Medioppia subpectinata]CAG2099962.1 unnamed protein product [Medioppia subpectinata]